MRISLRELMIVVAVVAVGLAGLKYADTAMLTVVQVMSGVLLLALLVRAAVDRGRGQAFAMGFVVCSVAYLVACVATLSDRTGINTFGTLAALRELHKVFITERWYNEATDQWAVNFRATKQEQQSNRTTRLELENWTPDDSAANDSVAVDSTPDDFGVVPVADGTRAIGMGRRGGGRGDSFAAQPAAVLPPPVAADVVISRPAAATLQPASGDVRAGQGFAPAELKQLQERSSGRLSFITPSPELPQSPVGVNNLSGTTPDALPQSFRSGRGAREATPEEAQQMRQQFGSGGGRGGRGRAIGRGGVTSQLTPLQFDEYASAGTTRRAQLTEILSMPAGQTAIQSGRPLSTMNLVTYVRRVNPLYDQFEVVGRCLWMLLIGYVGGLFGRFIYSRRKHGAAS